MNPVKKKEIQIFSNGSCYFKTTIIKNKEAKKVKIYNKDHITFIFNKKDTNSLLESRDFKNCIIITNYTQIFNEHIKNISFYKT